MSRVGVNLGDVAPYTQDQLWADLAKSARPFCDESDNMVSLDANGWPTVASQLGIAEGSAYPASMVASGYKLRCLGPSNLVISNRDNTTITNAAHAGGVWTADLQINARDNTSIRFSTAIQDLSIMRPGHVRGVDYWNQDFLAALASAPMSVIRPMHSYGPGMNWLWGATGVGVSNNRDTAWASRKSRPRNVGFAYNGMPWEDAVILSNVTGADIWVCIPENVDRDYVTKMAQVFRYGSDGVTPYTTTTHDPATWDPSITSWFPGLLPGRKVYLEFGNEIWNGARGEDGANEDIAAGDPHKLGSASAVRWNAWKCLETSQLWRAVWGDAKMHGTGDGTIRPTMAQQGDMGAWANHDDCLLYMSTVWGASSPYGATIDGIANAKQPPSYYVHNISGGFYLHWKTATRSLAANATNITTAFADYNQSLSTPGGLGTGEGEWGSRKQYMDAAQTVAAKWGVSLTSYEWGSEAPAGALALACRADARMRTLYDDLQAYFFGKAAADCMCHFWLAGDSTVDSGLGADCTDTATYRWASLQAIAGPLTTPLTIAADAPSGGFIRIHGTRPAGSTVGLYRRS